MARGYARNYLVPRGLAQPVTSVAKRQMEILQASRQARLVREKDEAEKLSGRMETMSVTVKAKVGPEGKLYGSVTTADIAAALKAEKIIVDRQKVDTGKPIRELGDHTVSVKLTPEVTASIRVIVEAE